MNTDGEEMIKDTKRAAETIAEIIKAAGDSPCGKAAANNLGKTAVTITSTINNALLPLAAVNYAFEKARKYFEERFLKDFIEKTKDIDNRKIIDPDPSIAGSVLQGLAFNHDNCDLRDMYLSLLSASIDSSKSDSAHPAFVDVLRQITPFEAPLIGQILNRPNTPIARVVLVDEDFDKTRESKNIISVKQHLLNIIDTNTGECSPDQRIELMIDNYSRLGLIEIDYDKSLVDESEYEWAYSHPLFLEYYGRGEGMGKLTSNDGKHTFSVALQFGMLKLTVFGKLFSVAVGINENPIHTNEA